MQFRAAALILTLPSKSPPGFGIACWGGDATGFAKHTPGTGQATAKPELWLWGSGLCRPVTLLCQKGSSQGKETEMSHAGSRNEVCSGLVEATEPVTLPLSYGHRTGLGVISCLLSVISALTRAVWYPKNPTSRQQSSPLGCQEAVHPDLTKCHYILLLLWTRNMHFWSLTLHFQ